MKLDEHFTVESETACWTLNYRRENPVNEETGKATVTTWQSYHISLKQALEAYFDAKLKLVEIVPENIIQIMESIKTVYSQIQKL